MRPFAAVLVALALLAAVGCSKKEEKKSNAMEIKKGDISESIEEMGHVEMSKVVEVRSEISGQLTSVNADVGDWVKKGQVVARVRGGLEAEGYKAADITAPMAGIVVDRNTGDKWHKFEPGDRIRDSLSGFTSGSVLMRIGRPDSLELTIQISEIDRVRLKEGQDCTVTVDAFPDKEYPARVGVINPTAVDGRRGVKVFFTKVFFKGAHPEIRPGMTARARIVVNSCKDCLKLPLARYFKEKNWTTNQWEHFAWLEGDPPQKAMVEVGARDGNHIAVLKGLTEGARVVPKPEKKAKWE